MLLLRQIVILGLTLPAFARTEAGLLRAKDRLWLCMELLVGKDES